MLSAYTRFQGVEPIALGVFRILRKEKKTAVLYIAEYRAYSSTCLD